MAQAIESASLVSTPTGGPTGSPNTVYVIGNTMTIAIDYEAVLTADPGTPTLRFQIGSQNRTAACAQDGNDDKRLLCSYVVEEGDTNGTSNNITIASGNQLVGGNLPDHSVHDSNATDLPAIVDGVRLALINNIGVTGGAATGFGSGSTIALTFEFGDGTTPEATMSNAGTLGATLVLENAERAARYISTSGGMVTFNYTVVAGDNGAFGLKLTGVDALTDTNGNRGLRTGWESTVTEKLAALTAAQRRVDTRGPRVTNIRITTPNAGSTVNGESNTNQIEFEVSFDESLPGKTATVGPSGVSLRVSIGNAVTSASCGDLSAYPTVTDRTTAGEKLLCRLTVSSGASGAISTPANPFNFEFIRDDLGNDASPTWAAQRFPDVSVDAVKPTVTGATITAGRRVNDNVVVKVTFSEAVKVGTADPTAQISFDGTSGAASEAITYAFVSNRDVEFRYPLKAADLMPPSGSSATSATVKLMTVVAGTGSVTDVAGNPAVVDISETRAVKTGATISLKATADPDTTQPRLDRISLRGTVRDVYGIGDTIDFDVLFSEPVTVTDTGSNTVAVAGRVGTEPLTAGISGGPATKFDSADLALVEDGYGGGGSLTVTGITLPDDGDLILDATTDDLTGTGNSNDAPGCDAGPVQVGTTTNYTHTCEGRGWVNDPDHPGVSGRTKVSPLIRRSLTERATVDTKRPKIESVKLLAAPGPSAVGRDGQRYYGEGDIIRIQVTMSEDVTVPATGSQPSLALSIGARSPLPHATFVTMTGKKNLIFEYKVQQGDDDRNGIEVSSFGIYDGSAYATISSASDGSTGAIYDVGGNGCAAADSGTGAHCGFTAWAGTQSARHAVDGSISGDQTVAPILEDEGTQPQTVSPAGTPVVRSTTPPGGYYKTGDTIRIEVPLNPAVTFTSAPQLLLNFDEGGSRRITAEGSFTTPRTNLVFNYPVQSGDQDSDGFTGTLSGGGPQPLDDGRRVTIGSISVSGIRIDALAPELESLEITSSAGTDGTYVAGDNIEVTATFSEDVERQGIADPSVAILVGESTKTATLQSPSSTAGGDTWVFRYTVVAGDSDADGVSIAANALEGDLEDAAGNEATITHAAVAASTAHRVDTQGPRVTGVAVTGAGDDNLFLEGDTITATVTFDEEVDVATSGSSAVRVRFMIGTSQRTATYAGGDDTTTLTFTYDVVAGDSGAISLPANALEGEAEDAAGNQAGSTPAVPVTPFRVDASAPTLQGSPSITSSPASGDTYVAGETITVQVSFDEPVIVSGEPRLPIMVGDKTRSVVRYTSGGGSDMLTFSYTVLTGDMDDDGVSVPAGALRLPGGATITDVNGLTAAVTYGALADQPGHKVDAVAPSVESLAITSTPASGDAYLIDETIEVTVTFSEDVATEGSPMLAITVGTGTRDAMCAQGGARDALMCSYTVAANDFDADGISVNADSLTGTITDMPGNAATLTHEALADDPDHKVYAAAPEAVGSIPSLSLAAGGGQNSLSLDGYFTGFQLSYSATTSDAAVATASVSGSDLTVVSGMEGTATITVTATNLAGQASSSFGVIVATDPVEKAVLNDALAAIGRSMLSSTANVIASRFELAATGSQMALGGSRFGGSLSPEMQRFLAGNDPFAVQERMGERALFSGSGSQQAYGGGYGLTADRLFTGTSFNMPLNAVGTGDAQFAVWGAGDLQSFEGEPDDGMYDGSSSSGYIGVDARGDGWLAGVSVSRSGAEADYSFDGLVQADTGGRLETSVTAFHPYARLEVGPDSEVWVIGGFGGGEADLTRTHVSGSQSSDLSMAMAVGGLRRALAMEFGGADLSLRGDAGFLSLETDSGMMAVDGLSASVSRLRLGLEAAWEVETLTPFVEVSGRFDGGDGQSGGGLELAGGVRLLSAESGFGLEAKGRVLAMHTGEGYSESGLSVTASFEPGAAGRGITFRLSPRWGGSADSTDLFWDEVGNVQDASQYAYGLDRSQTWGVDAALGYGFGLRSMPGIVTPFGQMDVTGDQDQRIRVGVRYGLMQGLLGGTQVELSAERVDGEMYRVGETRVLVSGRARF